MRVLTFPVVFAIASLLSGCAGSGGGGSGGGGGGSACKPPPVAQRTVSFAGNIQPIFNRSCALSGCHVPGALGGNLDLSPGAAYNQIVGHDAFQQPKRKRVLPGDPANSYLVMKIEGTPGISGLPMPQGCPVPPPGGSCLAPDDDPAIRKWITECATNN